MIEPVTLRSQFAVRLVAIVNSFNRLELLKIGLPSLYRTLGELGETWAIIVYDAGSKDGTRDWLAEFKAMHPEMHLELVVPKRCEDTSFSAGINAACGAGFTMFPHLCWLFLFETDNWIADARPLRMAIQLLERRRELAATGFTVTRHDGTNIGFGCAFPTITGFVMGPQLAERLSWDSRLRGDTFRKWTKEGEIEWAYADVIFTSPIMITKEAWVTSAGMDGKLFPFSDCDLDWAWRLRKLGMRQAVIRVSGVVHDNQLTLSQWSATRVIHLHRARLKLLRIHIGNWVGLFKPLLLLRHLIEWIGLLVFGFRRPHWRGSLSKRWQLIRTVFTDYN